MRAVAELKRAYLFHGDDEVKIDQARKRLAARAERDGAVLETVSGEQLTPENFAMTLTSPSLLPGTRIVLADGIEAWKAAELGPAADAVELLGGGDIDAVAVLICRKKPLKAMLEAVKNVGGEVREFKPPSERQLPEWLGQQAEALGAQLAPRAAARLVEIVGRPSKRASAAKQWSQKRRLLSELEKLCINVGPGGTIDLELVEQLASGETTAEVFALTDHAVSGAHAAAVADAERLLASGSAVPMVTAMLARTFRQLQAVGALIESGREKEIGEVVGGNKWLADKLVRQARERGSRSAGEALVAIARLDTAVKGGSALDDQTELLRTVETIAG